MSFLLFSQPIKIRNDTIGNDSVALLIIPDYLIDHCLNIDNEDKTTEIFFALSFDTVQWAVFSLKPLRSTLFDLKGYDNCFFSITTKLGNENKESKYLLQRSNYYGIIWNNDESQWSIHQKKIKN